jgi:hypothetical protein
VNGSFDQSGHCEDYEKYKFVSLPQLTQLLKRQGFLPYEGVKNVLEHYVQGSRHILLNGLKWPEIDLRAPISPSMGHFYKVCVMRGSIPKVIGYP